MYRSLWLKLAALLLLAASLCGVLSSPAFAESTVEVLPAPEVAPRAPEAHGDGSVTITNNCVNHEWEENAAVTISPKGEVLSTIPRKEGEWENQACFYYMAAGFDNTVYVLQTGSVPYYLTRIAAYRGSRKLWTQPLSDPAGCGERQALIQSMIMGQDGNLYIAAYWGYKSESCPKKEALISINPSTGAVRFIDTLPNTDSGTRGSGISEVQPYKDGVIILNGNEVFYFSYEGEKESSKTFTAASGEEEIVDMKIVPDTGRVYWFTQIYNPELNEYEKFLYCRDSEGSISEEIKLPEKQLLGYIHATPDNGVVAEWKEKHSGSASGFDYINEEGSVAYEKNLSTEAGYSVQETGLSGGIMVDDLGNVIVRRTMDESSGDHDRNVVVDSFSPAGIKTRLFNSSSLGTKGVVDSFTTYSALAYGAMGKGHIYLVVCHIEGKISEGCNSSMNPEVVSISDTTIGEYDYPRSAIFKAGLEKSSYVALGDSYSSGEGVPEFIPPSDEDGCHRSYNAYPADLAEDVPSLRLDAFVACSGAKTSDVEEGMDEEPSQLDALGPETEIVTITVGGNDIGFKEFATDCVVSTCDSSSPYYASSMEKIAVELPEELGKTYGLIHEYAENAEVFVVGYPQVAPKPGVECMWLVDSEKEATREVVTEMDKAIQEAAEAVEGKFIYVNPNTEASPFFGHELCMEESYFNGLTLPEDEYSFHPNERGQQAYAELIAEVL